MQEILYIFNKKQLSIRKKSIKNLIRIVFFLILSYLFLDRFV